MVAVRKRGNTFHVDVLLGRSHAIRGSLGTRNKYAAKHLAARIESALAEGPRSTSWAALKPVLPSATFARLTKFVGVEEKQTLTWKEFRELFENRKKQQMKMNKLSIQTLQNYEHSLDRLDEFLAACGIMLLQDINRTTADKFGQWRIDRVTRPQSTGGAPSLDFDLRHLHHAFEVARELEFIANNPWPSPAKTSDRHIATPFSADEIAQWEDAALKGPQRYQLFPIYDEWFPFWHLRWTGFRPYDAIELMWEEVLLDQRLIKHQCHKNHERVSIPIFPDEHLIVALESERRRRNPQPTEQVMLNPHTGTAFTYPQLWRFIGELGERAGVQDAHPYRFRGTYAVEMQLRTNDPYYVARLLGDTMGVVERHYMPYVKELLAHNRLLAEGGVGLRGYVTRASQSEKGRVVNIRRKSA